ncbi:hypothetical protein [Miltoncostaea oceani]|uniref:hypothetical protein n=1 Tax=Miltoncostaea oceani TaxID=2843216 RepID=UPI001C3D0B94|nr:hypothetical protein [Miltoncostaea oceani]
MLTLGRIVFDAPDSLAEGVGEAVARVGATPVAGARSGLSSSLALTTWADTSAERERIRRQLRSLLNNLPARDRAVYLSWPDDPEHDGWYVPGATTFDLEGVALDTAVWKLGTIDLALVGRPRTHRRAVVAYLRDRRVATEARDQLRRIYSTNFSGMTPSAVVWLPSTITDALVSSFSTLALTTARTGYGGASIVGVVSPADLAVIHFEQAAANRNLGDVVVYDRRGTLTGPTSGPASQWEEAYGPDWPCDPAADWRAGADVPVLDNGICRVRFDAANTDGFAIDRWTGAAWAEQGKVLVERVGASTAYCDTLVSANVVEWTADRAVVRAVMRLASDVYSREEVYITLQTGWTGPRFEVYPGPVAAGTPAGAGVHVFRQGAPAGTETANKFDASLQTVTGVPSFAAGAVGAASFTGENWIVMRRTGVNAIALAALQSAAAGRVENSSSAYGSARNGISIRAAAGTGYVSAHLGMNAASGTDAYDSVNGQLDGARDLGKQVLYDARSPQTIVSR